MFSSSIYCTRHCAGSCETISAKPQGTQGLESPLEASKDLGLCSGWDWEQVGLICRDWLWIKGDQSHCVWRKETQEVWTVHGVKSKALGMGVNEWRLELREGRDHLCVFHHCTHSTSGSPKGKISHCLISCSSFSPHRQCVISLNTYSILDQLFEQSQNM